MSTSGREEEETGMTHGDSLEYLSQSRDRAETQLGNGNTDANYDISCDIKEIRAILQTNAEIFNRVMGSITTKRRKCWTTFETISFHSVDVRTVGHCTQFRVKLDREEELFDITSLTDLPDDMNPSNSLQISFEDSYGAKFVDFESLFERSLLLHDSILGPFLRKFKHHLMSVQVSLGKIDEWLFEIREVTNFVETTFDKELKFPCDGEELEQKCQCQCGVHLNDEKCLECNESFDQHCVIKGVENCCPYQNDSHFACKKSIVLKKFYLQTGRHETSFGVLKRNENDRINLKKFLDFANSAGIPLSDESPSDSFGPRHWYEVDAEL